MAVRNLAGTTLLISYICFNLKILMLKFYVSAVEVHTLNRTSTDMKQHCQCLIPLPLIPVYILSQLWANTSQGKDQQGIVPKLCQGL